jgi:formylglycine-generating enzyme
VINVSWANAVRFARWLSSETGKTYRLPSEAEWEYAARSGGKEEKWAGTSREPELGEYAWYKANSGAKTQPVGSKRPSGLGLYDMSGSVWEWVQDWWNETYDGAPTDGKAWLQGGGGGERVIRGGSWDGRARDLRASFRLRCSPISSSTDIGFRLARDLD